MMLYWERRGIRDTWAARAEWGSTIAALPHFFYVVVLRLLYFLVISVVIPCEFLARKWCLVFPWSWQNRIKRQRKRRDKYRDESLAARILKASAAKPIQLGERILCSSIPETADLFFGRFPPEIRRLILVRAFGERTIRMELNFEPLPLLGDRDPASQGSTAHTSDIPREEWVWRGIVCPPSPQEDAPPLSLGRRLCDAHEYYVDERFTELSRESLRKRRIGIMGWLLACRQAYIEGVEVLYGTNTLQVSSKILLRGMQDLVPSTMLSAIKSLELVWDPQHLRIKQILEGLDPKDKKKHTPPLFPSLSHLHLHLSSLEFLVIGVPEADGTRYILSLDELASDTPRTLDTVLAKIAPPTAEVVVTCRYLDWFKLVGQKLIQSQGVENMRLEESEFGGPRFWRQIPPAEDPTVDTSSLANVNLENGVNKFMQGYWIHLVPGIMESHWRSTQPPLDARRLFWSK